MPHSCVEGVVVQYFWEQKGLCSLPHVSPSSWWRWRMKPWHPCPWRMLRTPGTSSWRTTRTWTRSRCCGASGYLTAEPAMLILWTSWGRTRPRFVTCGHDLVSDVETSPARGVKRAATLAHGRCAPAAMTLVPLKASCGAWWNTEISGFQDETGNFAVYDPPLKLDLSHVKPRLKKVEVSLPTCPRDP